MLKIIKIFLPFVLILYFIAPADAKVHQHKKRPKKAHHAQGFSAKAALLWNITQDKVYFSRNDQQKIYPASTTKVMTVLLALETLSLDQYVTVSARATDVQPTKLDFRAGEEYTVKDLIYACLLKSANDAAVVLAEAVAGSQEKFVTMMNQKAQSLGAKHTRFSNPHGLPSRGQQYTTARDMALILREALKNSFFEQATTLRYRIIYSKTGRRHFLKTHNKALFLNWKEDVFGKTGYTRQAQSCFVGYFKKGKDTIIADVFGCSTQKRWDDLKWMIERYSGVNL